jgi:predicted nucleic acid-binding protein
MDTWIDAFASGQQALFEAVVQPLAVWVGAANLLEQAYEGTGWLLAGLLQIGLMLLLIAPLEKIKPVERWLDQLAGAYNILPMDAAVFRQWAKLMHRQSDTLYEDAMIAATAKVHGLTIATRNMADFQALGLEVFNPFKQA